MTRDRTYWLDLFTWTTWQEFLQAGGTVSGFKARRWNTVRQIKPGDYLLCYLMRVMRFIGLLEVTSQGYQDDSKIWEDDIYPCRLKVNLVADLTPETAVPVLSLKNQLSIFQNQENPQSWVGHFRGSPQRFSSADGEVIVQAILEARQNPVFRPLDED